MDILNFDNLRAGKYPACLDISKIGLHTDYGVYAQAWTLPDKDHFVQFRKHNDNMHVAIFSFHHEVELDEYWKNSTVIWDSRNS